MKLRVLTPTEVILEQEVVHVTAEDPTGSLGIRPGHEALVTPLVPGVIHARNSSGQEQYVAVNGGVMLVGKDVIEIVSRQAIAGNDLQHLETHVVADFEKEILEDQANRVAFEKLRISFMRGVIEYDKANVQ
jgi:F-type H+-transporting ATPase subunit epsilon